MFKIFSRLFEKLSENYYKKDNPYIKPKNNSSLEIRKKFYLKVPFAEKEAAKNMVPNGIKDVNNGIYKEISLLMEILQSG